MAYGLGSTRSGLRVSNLSICYEKGVVAADGVTFEIAAGKSLALVGSSGAGKSSIALSLCRLLPGDATVTGQVQLGNRSLFDLDIRAMQELRRNSLSFIFQDAIGSFVPSVRIGKQLLRVIKLRRPALSDEDVELTSTRLLAEVGLSDAERVFRSYPQELSGGMCQRVLIAMALCNEPELVIADEPLSALDPISQVAVLALIANLQEKHGFAMLYVTHDFRVASGFEQIGVLDAGRLVEIGPAQRVIGDPKSDRAIRLVAAADQLSLRVHRADPPVP